MEGGFLGRPDLFYRSHRLAIEYDGASHRDNLTGDNRRQNLLMNADYSILRFTADDVLRGSDSVVAQVRKALVGDDSPANRTRLGPAGRDPLANRPRALRA